MFIKNYFKMKYFLLYTFCVFICIIIPFVELLNITLMRQESPRNSLQRLPKEYQPHINNLFNFKPKPPHNYTNDSIALFRFMDTEFYGVVGIGKPVRFFNMIFDTTWGNSWVISDECPPQVPACWFHNKYDGSRSSSHIDNGSDFLVNEGTYNISGFFSNDTLHIAHMNLSNFQFGEVTNLPWPYMLSKADGIIGMSKDKLVSTGSPPFYYELFRRGIIKQPIISIYINRDRSSNRGGNIFLGGIEKHYNGSFTYIPSVSKYFWDFKMDRIIVNVKGKSFPLCVDGCTAVVDTSTNAIVGPSSELKRINRLIKAKPIAYGRFEIDCDRINILPNISFVMNGHEFVLKGPDYVQRVAYHGVELCLSTFTPVNNYLSNEQQWTLGGAFLSAYYTVLDLATNRVGFATILK